MTYNNDLITDEIFPIYERTNIELIGTEQNVKLVESEIRKCLYNLKVLTLYLLTPEYLYVKANICQLKTLIDPADLRLRKKDNKLDKEIKHSFYYVPNCNKDVVIIGFEKYYSFY